MGNCDVTFCAMIVFHVTSKAVLPQECAKRLLQDKSIGNEIYQEPVQTRLQGKESICPAITKRKLKTFKTQSKMMKKKIDGRVVQLIEDRHKRRSLLTQQE